LWVWREKKTQRREGWGQRGKLGQKGRGGVKIGETTLGANIFENIKKKRALVRKNQTPSTADWETSRKVAKNLMPVGYDWGV